MDAHWQDPWGDRRQEIVFIGAGIDWPALTARLDACLLPEHLAPGPDALPDLPDPFPGLAARGGSGMTLVREIVKDAAINVSITDLYRWL